MRFLVIIPTHDHGRTVQIAIRSVQRQRHGDWRLVVVADGAPERTHALVQDFAAKDARIALRIFPKGQRHGEAWRHEVLAESDAEAVAYLGDDDFWAPHHLAALAPMLQTADLVHTRQTELLPDMTFVGLDGGIGDPDSRRCMMIEADPPWNCFGPTVAAHRLDAYRRLPVGWSPAPPGLFTDLHMWRKFIVANGMRFAHSAAVTSLKLGSPHRIGRSEDERLAEGRRASILFRSPHMWRALAASLPATSKPIGIETVVDAALADARRSGAARAARARAVGERSVAGRLRRAAVVLFGR